MKTDNELIAEFMGYKEIDTINSTKHMKYYNKGEGPLIMDSYFLNHHAYSASWDWLMPVVEKIEKFQFDDGELDEGDEPDAAFLRTFKGGMVRINRFTLHHCETKLEATYMAVVEFIKWYNSESRIVDRLLRQSKDVNRKTV